MQRSRRALGPVRALRRRTTSSDRFSTSRPNDGTKAEELTRISVLAILISYSGNFSSSCSLSWHWRLPCLISNHPRRRCSLSLPVVLQLPYALADLLTYAEVGSTGEEL